MKTFLDSEFYMRPMVNQSSLAKHWKVSATKINEMVHSGLITLNKAGLISMKQIMEVEELGVNEISSVNLRSIMRENNKLKEENQKLRNAIAEIEIILNSI